MDAINPTTEAVKKVLATADKIIFFLIRAVCIVSFVGLFVLALANVFLRLVPVYSLSFFDEVQVWLLGAMIFWGAAGVWTLRDHMKVDDVAKALFGKSPVLRAAIGLVIELASMFFICVFTYASLYQVDRFFGETNALRIPEKIVFLTSMSIPGIIMVVYSVRNIAVSFLDLVRAGRPQAEGEGTAPGP